MEEMFKKECEELGIDYKEFPFDFPIGGLRHYPTIFAAMMWILKKRQGQNVRRCIMEDKKQKGLFGAKAGGQKLRKK